MTKRIWPSMSSLLFPPIVLAIGDDADQRKSPAAAPDGCGGGNAKDEQRDLGGLADSGQSQGPRANAHAVQWMTSKHAFRTRRDIRWVERLLPQYVRGGASLD